MRGSIVGSGPILRIAWVWLLVLASALPAFAGETLKAVKARGVLRCGVSEGLPGFSERGPDGVWKGLDVEFCRAVAAAALGDADKVRFKALKASERFPALKGGLIDLLLRNTSWTLGREVGLRVKFPGILFYDGQGFMVRSDAAATRLDDLAGKAVCLVKGTSHVENTANTFAGKGWGYTPVIVDTYDEGLPLLQEGRCQALAGDISLLATKRQQFPGGKAAFRLLPERISKEPLAPVVRDDDPEWTSLVRWVLFLLLAAEEDGYTRDNVLKVTTGQTSAKVSQSLEACRAFARPLGIPSDWAVRVLAGVGNYGEIFERTLGRNSPYGLERGLNGLWTQGGLMYAPPMR